MTTPPWRREKVMVCYSKFIVLTMLPTYDSKKLILFVRFFVARIDRVLDGE